jgi:hypothetical protein
MEPCTTLLTLWPELAIAVPLCSDVSGTPVCLEQADDT